jgi:hypothetical protein
MREEREKSCLPEAVNCPQRGIINFPKKIIIIMTIICLIRKNEKRKAGLAVTTLDGK